MLLNTKKKKVLSRFRINLRTPNPSYSDLKAQLPLLPFRTLVRFGSTTELEDGKTRVELNSADTTRISSNKLLMKQKFNEAGVKTATWYTSEVIHGDLLLVPNVDNKSPENTYRFVGTIEYPIVAKAKYGSKGKGNTLIKSEEEFNNWLEANPRTSNFIFEKFYNYLHEFRLHVSKDGYFYTCRKALKQDTPEEDRWRFHSDTTTWYLEDNEKFFKPNSWNDIVSDCIKALEAIGGDILAFDVKVQSPTTKKGEAREYQDYILLECNSAPELAEIGTQRYLEVIPKILQEKYNESIR